MIHVTLDPHGHGQIHLPTSTRPITASGARAARDVAVRILTEHAADVGHELEVAVTDDGEHLRLRVQPDGRVDVDRTAPGGYYPGTEGTAHQLLLAPPRFDPEPHTTAPPHALDATPLHAEELLPESISQTVAPTRHAATVTLSGGRRITIHGRALVGRRPTPPDTTVQIIAIDDDTRSISKTHCALEWSGTQLRITDLHSTNGTTIERGEDVTPVDAGQTAQIIDGDTIHLGEVSFTVTIATDMERPA